AGAWRGASRCHATPTSRAGRGVARSRHGGRTLTARRLMKAKRVLIVAAVSAAALASGGWLLERDSTGGSVYRQARLFDEVLAQVADNYVDSIDERQLYQMAIDGLLDTLHDPYTV